MLICVEDYFTDIIQKKKSDIQFCLLISISLWKHGISLFRWSKKMHSTGQSDQNWWFQPALASFFFWVQYESVNRLWAVCWHVIWGSSDCNREDAVLTIDLLNPCHRIRCNAVIMFFTYSVEITVHGNLQGNPEAAAICFQMNFIQQRCFCSMRLGWCVRLTSFSRCDGRNHQVTLIVIYAYSTHHTVLYRCTWAGCSLSASLRLTLYKP